MNRWQELPAWVRMREVRRYRYWVGRACRNPVGALRFASQYSRRMMEPALHRRLQPFLRPWTLKRLGLSKVLNADLLAGTTIPTDGLLSGKLTVLGKTIDFRGVGDWLADFEGGQWPELRSHQYDWFFSDDFSLPEYREHGDVKRVWDLNKHHHFVELARAFRQTHDQRYQEVLTEQFLGWTKRFPYGHGIGWNQPLIVAQRAINWIICYNLDAFPRELHQVLLEALFDHGSYLKGNLEINQDGNNSNHLIGDLAALHLIGLTLKKDDWRDQSLEMLMTEIKRQVYDDGVHYEQSSGYHRYVLEFLTLVWQANQGRPGLLADSIERMSNFLNDIAADDGRIPFLSDWDGAKVWLVDHMRPAELYSLGRKSLTSVPYKDGGYYVLRGGPFHVIFDCGPIGMAGRQLSTHGHSDLLSICLNVSGEPFIVDPGSGTYTQDKRIHDYFRSTSGHNTLTIDGKDQCGLGRTWTLDKHPTAKLLFWETGTSADRVSGEHDSYAPIIHRREITLVKEPVSQIRMRDEIIGEGVHSYQCYFHISPSILPEISGTTARLISRESTLEMKYERTLVANKIKGLYAPDYGEWIEAPVLLFEGRSRLPTRIEWEFSRSAGYKRI